MEATSSGLKINHSSAAAAGNLFNEYNDDPNLRALCIEAEANIPRGTPNRSIALVDAVVQRVYKEARAWRNAIPTQLYNRQQNTDDGLCAGLYATQKANNAFHNLTRTFERDPAVGEFKSKKFKNADEMYKFFAQKDLITSCFTNDTLDPVKTIMTYRGPKPVHLSLQGLGIETLHSNWLSEGLISLNLSSNSIKSIDEVKLPQNLATLDLSYNLLESAPHNLAHEVTNLSLRGNPIEKLTSFDGLERLTELDIAYVGKNGRPVDLLNSFWINFGAKKTITISPGMEFMVPQEIQNRVTFLNAQNNEALPIINGLVECKAAQLIKDPDPSPKAAKSRSFASFVLKCLGISAVLALIGYLGWKLWTRARA